MIVQQVGQYAMRLMVVLSLEPERRMRAAELAERTSISPTYVSKVLRRLTEAELLDAQKGHAGGFVLAYPPEQITVQDILRAVGIDFTDDACAFGWEQCSDRKPCPLHPLWSQLKGSVMDWANGNTLADARE